MTSLKNRRKNQPGLDNIDVWPMPETMALSEAMRNDFQTKKYALDQYIQGVSFLEIEKTTGINRQFLHYLIRRCIEVDKRGNLIGYFGLIKGKHVNKRNDQLEKLSSGFPSPGSLEALFKKYPDLLVTMRKLIVDRIAPESHKKNERLTWPQMHHIFLDQCSQLGIKPPCYPFCSNSKGKRALVKWGKELLSESMSSSTYLVSQSSLSLSLACESLCHKPKSPSHLTSRSSKSLCQP